jgi:hypothetical protein
MLPPSRGARDETDAVRGEAPLDEEAGEDGWETDSGDSSIRFMVGEGVGDEEWMDGEETTVREGDATPSPVEHATLPPKRERGRIGLDCVIVDELPNG